MATMIEEQLTESLHVKQAMLNPTLMRQIERICDLCVSAYQNQHKLLFCGNGGSAADAQHLAAELVSRFYFNRPALPAIALTTDTSILTAIGNDYGYETLFSRQVEALGQAGDVLIALSTSGNSPNILRALAQAKRMNLTTIGLTGQTGGQLAQTSDCDVLIQVPSTSTPRIQEGHTLVGHILCAVIEARCFSEFKPNTDESGARHHETETC